MFHMNLFRIRAFWAGNLAGFLASIGRGGLQFMLIIWLQGIWLPLHGYNYQDTPLWAGIYLLPLTSASWSPGRSPAGSPTGSARGRSRPAACWSTAVTFVGLLLLPTNFPYWQFAVLIALNGIGSGLFAAPNTTAIMNSVPASQRGAATGMRGTFFNSGSSLSIGIFFSLMIAGLASTLPKTLTSGLAAQGVPHATAAADRQPAAGGQPVRGVPRLQPDAEPARPDRHARSSSRRPTPPR